MLVLSRRLNEKIVLPDLRTAIQVVSVNKGVVRLGIEAPPEVTILRAEVQERQDQWKDESSARAAMQKSAPPAAKSVPAPQESAPSPAELRLAQLLQLLNNRLKISGVGLAQLRRQLQAGGSAEAEVLLHQLEDDLQMLRDRLERETKHPPVRRRALLVEDNPNERELLASFLRKVGLDVDTASDGNDALDYLNHHRRPDVVLLDMGLPRCDGPTMVRTLRRDPAYSDLKIFAVSGHLPEEYDLAQGPGGIDRWFHKPINPADLVNDLNQDLEQPLSPRR
jgi:carbon storage regulator CsrA